MKVKELDFILNNGFKLKNVEIWNSPYGDNVKGIMYTFIHPPSKWKIEIKDNLNRDVYFKYYFECESGSGFETDDFSNIERLF